MRKENGRRPPLREDATEGQATDTSPKKNGGREERGGVSVTLLRSCCSYVYKYRANCKSRIKGTVHRTVLHFKSLIIILLRSDMFGVAPLYERRFILLQLAQMLRFFIFNFIQFRQNVFFITVGANGMAELGFAVLGNETFHLLPVLLVIAYFLAIHANRQ